MNNSAIHRPARVFSSVVLSSCSVMCGQAVVMQLDALSTVSGGTRPTHHTAELFASFVRGWVAVALNLYSGTPGHLHTLLVRGDAAHGRVVVLGAVPCVCPNSPIVTLYFPFCEAFLRYLAWKIENEGNQLCKQEMPCSQVPTCTMHTRNANVTR